MQCADFEEIFIDLTNDSLMKGKVTSLDISSPRGLNAHDESLVVFEAIQACPLAREITLRWSLVEDPDPGGFYEAVSVFTTGFGELQLIRAFRCFSLGATPRSRSPSESRGSETSPANLHPNGVGRLLRPSYQLARHSSSTQVAFDTLVLPDVRELSFSTDPGTLSIPGPDYLNNVSPPFLPRPLVST